MIFHRCVIDHSRCRDCGFCSWYVNCPGRDVCVDCKVCYLGCPSEAILRVVDDSDRRIVKVNINGESFEFPERITLKRALEIIGFSFTKLPFDEGIFAPCETGGCFACAALVNGKVSQLCTTPVRDGMSVELEADFTPVRIVSGFMPHTVGGVGTPWYLKREGRYIEVACFAHGCNFRCPQCQNWTVTYGNNMDPISPEFAAEKLSLFRRTYGVNRMAISGGEPTLNRRWLVAFFRELRRLNSDRDARLHLDTNASLLTRDYIDELIEAGVTDIGADIKALNLDTFIEVTGVYDEDLARFYLNTAWDAVKYIVDEYFDRVFLGVGVPYNKAWMSDEELFKIGCRLAEINPSVQVCLLDYRPEFRRRDLKWPSFLEMRRAKKILEEAGLRVVIAQTRYGHIGP